MNTLKALFFMLRGVLAVVVVIINTVFFTLLMYIPILLKIIVPSKDFKRKCTAWLVWCSECWIKLNMLVLSYLHNTQWEVSGIESVSPEKWYFLISNHQSFTDVFVLQKILTSKIAPFKYFMKQSLIWMPLIGIAWWALDCIFMKRYSKQRLLKEPHLREVDKQTTKQKCLQFKHTPVTIVNFLEGTRFTLKKHDAQHSPYQHLLKPRAGGLAYMMAAMDGRVQEIINVTIAYLNGPYTFWDFLCGKVTTIKVHLEVLPVPVMLLQGDYVNDPHYRDSFQSWLGEIWHKKDQLLQEMVKNNA